MSGSTPDQVYHYSTFCRYRAEGETNGEVDLRNCGFIFPTTLVPLLAASRSRRWPWKVDEDSQVGGYLNYILSKRATKARTRSYVAPIELPASPQDFKKVLESLQSLRTESAFYRGNEDAYTYTIGELSDNIYEHSEFKQAFVMGQKYRSGGYVELCFFDDGVSIPGSFAKHGRSFPDDRHTEAILEAVRGASTKPDHGRGFGLSTNVEMFRDIGGEVFIASGNGALFIDRGRLIPYRLDESSRMDGTLISLRVTDRERVVNVYEYAERGSSL